MRQALILGAVALLLAGPWAPALAAPSQANVGNRIPTVVSMTVPANVSPTSGTTTSVTVTPVFDDRNGHNDFNGVTLTVYKADNITVHVASAAATKTGGSGRQATYSYAFAMNHYDDPGTYYVRATATDRASASVLGYTSFAFGSLAAVSLGGSTITLGSGAVSPGASTNSTPATVTVTNSGNTAIDLQHTVSALTNSTNSTTIAIGNMFYSKSSDMSGSVAMAGSATTDTAFNLAKGSGSTKNVYISIVVPNGTRAGTYTGTITLAAVADS